MYVVAIILCWQIQSNSFVDRRFGEYDEEMSVEEKMLQRFAFQKKVQDYTCVYLNTIY